jgi:ABC-2 type transport system permease protein
MKRLFEVARTSAWLGWQVEGNWADPLLFLGLAVAKPLATTLILFLMVRVVAPDQATGSTFRYLFLGNAFFLYVSEVLVGISWAVFRDREDYETLKYIYVAPIRLVAYFVGRGFTKVVTATIGVLVTLAFGAWVLGIEVAAPGTSWGAVIGATFLGLCAVLSLGVALAGVSLVVARHSMSLNEGVSGMCYLVSGAVFPVEVLPRWAQSLSLALPFTYWLELLRRLLTGKGYSRLLAGRSDASLWAVLWISFAGLSLVAMLWFTWCERRARARGLIDWKTNY